MRFYKTVLNSKVKIDQERFYDGRCIIMNAELSYVCIYEMEDNSSCLMITITKVRKTKAKIAKIIRAINLRTSNKYDF